MRNPEKFEPQFEEKMEKESRLDPEDEELILDIINHSMVKKRLERYRVFSGAYFEQKGKFKGKNRDEIKQRADKILGEDAIYKGILELGRPVEDKDFIEPIAKQLGYANFDRLKQAKKEGNLNKILEEIIIENMELKPVKKMLVEFSADGKICRPHLPILAEDWKETIPKIIESARELARNLQPDENGKFKNEEFKNVERIEGCSWLFGKKFPEQRKLARDLDREFGWQPSTDEENEKFKNENPDKYEESQRGGLKSSPHMFKKYLLTGEMPDIEGRWIAKDEFIEKMKGVEEKP